MMVLLHPQGLCKVSPRKNKPTDHLQKP